MKVTEGLINGVQMNMRHPETFHIPSDRVRSNLTAGDFVKIGLDNGERGERFWVKILSVQDSVYMANIENDLVYHNFKCNDQIWFKAEHVLCEPSRFDDIA